MEYVNTLIHWPGPFFLIGGTIIGFIFGILPGLGGLQVLALLTPLTFGMDPQYAFILLIGAMGAVPAGGSVSAILINTPGTSQNVAAALDGYPLTQQGKAGYALGASVWSSCLGGIFGAAILMMLIPVTRKVVLAFSYPEFFMLALLGICSISALSTGNRWKGLISGFLGLFLTIIGSDPIVGIPRLDFGIDYLSDGIKLIPVVIGVYAITEAVDLLLKGEAISAIKIETSIKDIFSGAFEILRNWFLFIRCSIIGVIIGIIPGIGGVVANFLAYSHAVQTEKNGKFGCGDVRGVIAPESAINAKDGGALVPTLTFGIPGSAEMAILLGALTIHGLEPGPKLLNSSILYNIVWTLVISNILVALLITFSSKYLCLITQIQVRFVAPIIFTLGILGAYATDGLWEDVIAAFIFGIVGLAMKRLGYSRVCLIIALVLGAIIEQNLYLTLSSMGIAGFFERPISLGLFIVTVLITISPLLPKIKRKRKCHVC